MAVHRRVADKDAVITDRDGRQYQLVVPLDFEYDMLLIRLIRHDHMVGEVKCVIESPTTMLLADLTIEAAVKRPLCGRIRASFTREPSNYRRMGLGSQLLQIVIDKAKDRHIQQIHGRITKDDLSITPNLREWYQRHSFRVEPVKDDPYNVATILLDFD